MNTAKQGGMRKMKDKILPLFLELYKKRKCTYKELAQACDCSERTAMRIVDTITPYVPLIVLRGCKGGGNSSQRL